MSNRTNRQRFYPEFYDDETEEVNEVEEVEKIEEIEKVEEVNENQNEISLEIPQNMYIENIYEQEEPENEIVPEPIPETEEIPETEIEIKPELTPFDREKAIEYAHRWALDRNPEYFDFEDLGGDCTNYVSQILLAGGCKMDKESVLYGWYYTNANNKSPSWTGVEQLYAYLTREKTYGIIAVETELDKVTAGDIAQLSFNGKTFQHSPFIVSVKNNPGENITYDKIKICAHSFDSENRSLDTYQWKKIRFIKILGFKEN